MDLNIDRLTLRMGDLSEAAARRLARLVAECLATADAPGAAATTRDLRISVEPRPGEQLEITAQRIADAILAAVARTS